MELGDNRVNATYSIGTVASVIDGNQKPPTVNLVQDGQTGQVQGYAHYTGPAANDRVVILTLGKQLYAIGYAG